MGNANSTAEAEAALNEADASAQRQGTGVKLFRYLPTGAAGQWVKVTDSADLDFYDANEDNEEKEAFWQLSMNNGDIDVPVDDQLDYSSNAKELRFTFTTETEALALKFPSKAVYDLFYKSFNDKLFFNKYKAENDSASRAKVLGADYAGMLYADNNDAQPMDEDDDEVAEGELLTPAREKKTRKEGTPISGIVMGALDNSFLMRGGQMEVMRNVEGGLEDRNVLFTTPIKGSSMTPSKVILASSETAMNVLNPDTPNSVLRLDLERNTVVNTWKFEKDGVEVPIRDISTNSKAAQLDSHNTFLGLDNNRLCRWDMRDPSRTPVQASPVVSWTGGKDFARGTNFKCMATSGDGYVVVGSQDGKIRLYNEKTLTQAKTSFPGLGAPVTAVDVTYDGKWVVATSDKHLMLLQTIFVDKAGKQTNGFKSRMGSAAPTPKLLRLRPEDQIRTQRKPLQKAKFTWVTEQGHQERRIVASCGNYTVVWDFKKVKAATAELGLGNLPTVMDYQLLPKDDQLVDSAFMHENFRAQDRDALLAITPHDIYTIN